MEEEALNLVNDPRPDYQFDNFKQETKAVINEIRGFIAMLYKFMTSDAPTRDRPLTLQQLEEVKFIVETILYKIELRHVENQWTQEMVETFESTPSDLFPESYESSDEDQQFEFGNVNAGRTFDVSVGRTNNEANGSAARNQTRGYKKAETSGSLEGILSNALNARSNLHRAKNYSNIHALFELE